MFKALPFKRRSGDGGQNRRHRTQRDRNILIVDLDSSEQPTFETEEGENFLLIKAGKRDLKVIKMAMRQLANKTSDASKFNPITEAEEIEFINKVDDRVRVAFDIASAGGA